eukprot:TRINITY_DN910_c0_g1_i5.p1 TRINITY_DN910_c0_g1~~TRINITY_DN910_c0_g1_i5.p1  ORF type:complete len:693 (+),score=146.53 TRINITY_DN910_c0_g1_i5:54-2132(+)
MKGRLGRFGKKAKNVAKAGGTTVANKTKEGTAKGKGFVAAKKQNIPRGVKETEVGEPAEHPLNIHILEAHELPVNDSNGTSDPFIVVKIAGNVKIVPTMKNEIHPVWTIDPFVFSTVSSKLFECQPIQVEVYDYNKVGKNVLLGVAPISTKKIHPKILSNEMLLDDWIHLKNPLADKHKRNKKFAKLGDRAEVHVQLWFGSKPPTSQITYCGADPAKYFWKGITGKASKLKFRVDRALRAGVNPNIPRPSDLPAGPSSALLSIAYTAGSQRQDEVLTTQLCDSIGMLLKAGADSKAQDQNGNTALHLALENGGSPQMCRVLIENKCEKSIQNNNGKTPEVIAYEKRILPCLQILNKSLYEKLLAVIEEEKRVAEQNMVDACAKGDLAAVKKSLADGVDPQAGRVYKKSGQRPIHAAASGGATEVLKLLLSKGAKITDQDSKKNTPLHAAATNDGAVETAKAILGQHNGGNKQVWGYMKQENADRESALVIARTKGCSNMAQYLEAREKDFEEKWKREEEEARRRAEEARRQAAEAERLRREEQLHQAKLNAAQGIAEVTCSACGGQGGFDFFDKPAPTSDNWKAGYKKCPTCGGTGKETKSTGVVVQQTTVGAGGTTTTTTFVQPVDDSPPAWKALCSGSKASIKSLTVESYSCTFISGVPNTAVSFSWGASNYTINKKLSLIHISEPTRPY